MVDYVSLICLGFDLTRALPFLGQTKFFGNMLPQIEPEANCFIYVTKRKAKTETFPGWRLDGYSIERDRCIAKTKAASPSA